MDRGSVCACLNVTVFSHKKFVQCGFAQHYVITTPSFCVGREITAHAAHSIQSVSDVSPI